MRRVIEAIRLIAPRRLAVLLLGETGTGKELAAQAIHQLSNRAQQPWVPLNCAALPAALVESELFGYVRGAFTGAERNRPGKFELAHKGTIFLDEIGDLPLESQAKLLRVLQDGSIQRLGSNETIPVDVRVIAATNSNLEEAVRARRFREDLFYRLNVVPIRLPALRDRRDDIPWLVKHFIHSICGAEDLAPKEITSAALQALQACSWPGNIRQLEHTVQAACIVGAGEPVLDLEHFHHLMSDSALPDRDENEPQLTEHGVDLPQLVLDLERSLVRQALERSQGNKARAAQLLRINRTTLIAKLKTWQDRDGFAISETPLPPARPDLSDFAPSEFAVA